MNSFKPTYNEVKPVSSSVDSNYQNLTMESECSHKGDVAQIKDCKMRSNESKLAAWKMPGNKCSYEDKSNRVKLENVALLESKKHISYQRIQGSRPFERTRPELGRGKQTGFDDSAHKDQVMQEEDNSDTIKIMNARRMNEIRKLDDFEKYEAIKRECPKLVAITNELMRSVRQLKYKYFPLLNSSTKQNVAELQAREHLEMKFDLLLSFCTNLALYISSKRENTNIKPKMSLKDIMNMKMRIAQLNEARESTQHARLKTNSDNCSDIAVTQNSCDVIPYTKDFSLELTTANQKPTSISITQAYRGQVEKTQPLKVQPSKTMGGDMISKKDESKKKIKCPSKDMINEFFKKREKVGVEEKNDASKLSRSIPRCRMRAKTAVTYHSAPSLQHLPQELTPFDRKFAKFSGYNCHESAEFKKLEMSLNFRKPSLAEMEEEDDNENDILNARLEDEFCRQMKKLKKELHSQQQKQKAKDSSHVLLMESEELHTFSESQINVRPRKNFN